MIYQKAVDGVIRDLTPEEIADYLARQPGEAEIIAGYMVVVQRHMDAIARSYGYDDIKTMASYADEPSVERYQQEGRAARAWRSLCWAACEQIRDEVKTGTREQPTDAQLIAELPDLGVDYSGPFAG